jgi:hypothetical protein
MSASHPAPNVGETAPSAWTVRPHVVLLAVLICVGAMFLVCATYFNLYDHKHLPFGDFFAIWSYAKIAAHNPVGLLYDFRGLHAAQVAMGLPGSQQAPFPYPPSFILMLWPLRPLPFYPALIGWLGAGFVLYLLACMGWRERPGTLGLIAVLAPTTAITITAGQGGFLSAGLALGGLRLLDRRPVLAGILLGLLTYKPQLGLLVPIALIAGGQWRAIAAACGTVLVLAAITTAVLGWAPWVIWVHSLPTYEHWFDHLTRIGDHRFVPTVTQEMLNLGLGQRAATLVQSLLACLAAAAVAVCCRRGPHGLAIPVVLLGCALATPHAFLYDFPIVTAAVVSFVAYRSGQEDRFSALEILALLAVTLFPVVIVDAGRPLPLATPTLLLFWLVVLHRRRRDMAAIAPSPSEGAVLHR